MLRNILFVALPRSMRLSRLGIVLLALLGMSFPSSAQIANTEALTYIKTTWNIKSYTDTQLISTLSMTYNGIAYRDYIGLFVSTSDAITAIDRGYFGKASLLTATAVENNYFGTILKSSQFTGVAATAKLAFAPTDLSLSNWRDAYTEAAYGYQVKLYFEARSRGCSQADINTTAKGAAVTAGIIKLSSGWLDDGSLLQNEKEPTLITWQQFITVAELLYGLYLQRDQYSLDNSCLASSFNRNAPYGATAEIGATPPSSLVGQTVTFQAVNPAAKSGLTITDYLWQFSDDASSQHGASVTHQFIGAGGYSVKLWIQDSDGDWSRQELSYSVVNTLPPAYTGPDLIIESITSIPIMPNVDTL